MSKKHKRRSVTTESNITFQGDNLDRLLSGHITPEVRREIYKEAAKLAARPHEREPAREPALLAPSSPLIAVMFDNFCDCGMMCNTFGYLARRVVEVIEGGTVERLAVVASAYEKPSGYITQVQQVPYCALCITQFKFYDNRHPDSGTFTRRGFAPTNASNAAIDGVRSTNVSETAN